MRERAERNLSRQKPSITPADADNIPRLIYELQTHQIELELQNKELLFAQEELQRVRDRYMALYDFSPLGYLTISKKGLILETNTTLVDMLGMERHLILKQPLSRFIATEDQDCYYLYLSKLCKTKQQHTCELRMCMHDYTSLSGVMYKAGTKHSSEIWVRMDSRHILDENEEIISINLSVANITEQRKSRDQLEYLAMHDQLTKLPNRYHLETELKHRISEAKRFNNQLAILFIDLDDFKITNDTLGHEFGDILLQQVAERLTSELRDYDILSRFGGDEFVVLIPNLNNITEAGVVANKLINQFTLPFSLKGNDSFITVSIGISHYPQDGKTCSDLLRSADTAMYSAKDEGGDHFCFFNQKMNDELLRQQLISRELRRALAQKNFTLHYQPLVDSVSGKIKTCEALLRWSQLDGHTISPNEFIPVAEKSELINRIGEWVINEACRQRAEWKAKGLMDFRIDINLSGRQFMQQDIFHLLKHCLDKFGLITADIGVELTENTFIDADDDDHSSLNNMNESGMQITIDDFGTGYSSLNYLRRLPAHNLKIDQEFIKNAPNDETDRSIMESIILIGHRLGMKVIVEGIETLEQHRLAQEIGCDLEQGYYIHKPLSAEVLFDLLTIQYDLTQDYTNNTDDSSQDS